MGSNRTAQADSSICSEGRESLAGIKTTGKRFHAEGNEAEVRNEMSKHTPEYVKRTAKLFESVTINEETKVKNGLSEKISSFMRDESTGVDKNARKISLDCLDGELNKKPSYLGVSCSNSGYRNVINYDSKIREGFWSANNRRESLVVSSSRLRESSPLRWSSNSEFRSGTHANQDSEQNARGRGRTVLEKDLDALANGSSACQSFINISTSTKTISTFRTNNEPARENIRNGATAEGETKVNLKQILSSKKEEGNRKGYSGVGFDPKILKSPEKNCNSFLKSISSFEAQSKNAKETRSESLASRVIPHSNDSILDRIQRLYGPGALAQGFYSPKSNGSKPGDSFTATVSSRHLSRGDNVMESDPNEVKSSRPVSETLKATNAEDDDSCGKATDSPKPEQKREATSGDNSMKGGHHFLGLLKRETTRLEELAQWAESELENGENLPEEISGKLRAAAGKARLLVSQKLRQFEGLCHKNLNEKEDEKFRTTSEDLAGFWDMVTLQIVQVYGVFDELEQLKNSDWKVACATKKSSSSASSNGQSSPAKASAKKSGSGISPSDKHSQKSESAKKAREEGRRKLLEERRKKMKELKQSKAMGEGEGDVEIFAK